MFGLQLARDARYYHAATLEEEGRADVVILASRLAGVGYDVTLRTALGEQRFLQKHVACTEGGCLCCCCAQG